MCETETLERINRAVRDLPEPAAQEVLKFAESLKALRPEPKIMTAESESTLYSELQARVDALPLQAESAREFIRRVRNEVRY